MHTVQVVSFICGPQIASQGQKMRLQQSQAQNYST
jgi:hypothetical protein